MSQYRRGADFERRVRAALEADGYEVIRSAGSKTPVDLIALKEPWQHRDALVFIQAKRTNGTCPPAERVRLLSLANIARAVPLVAYQPLPRKPIAYRRLTGPGPKDWQPWTPDEAVP
jgi:Holliday junction resolvase